MTTLNCYVLPSPSLDMVLFVVLKGNSDTRSSDGVMGRNLQEVSLERSILRCNFAMRAISTFLFDYKKLTIGATTAALGIV